MLHLVKLKTGTESSASGYTQTPQGDDTHLPQPPPNKIAIAPDIWKQATLVLFGVVVALIGWFFSSRDVVTKQEMQRTAPWKYVEAEVMHRIQVLEKDARESRRERRQIMDRIQVMDDKITAIAIKVGALDLNKRER